MLQARSKILYHGSAVLFDKIEVDKGLPRKDFGKGFYMSVSKKQAEGALGTNASGKSSDCRRELTAECL